MKTKITLLLIAIMATVSVNAQLVKVYHNGVLEKSYLNTSMDEYKVVFSSGYVEIGGLKWATMNLGATTVAESPETSIGDYYAWGELDTYYSSIDWKTADGKPIVKWGKVSTITNVPGEKTGHNMTNYGGGQYSVWNPIQFDIYKEELLPERDVVRKKLGGKWRIPTLADFEKLYYACGGSTETTPVSSNITVGGNYWVPANTTVDGETYKVTGMLFVAADDINKRVFFPITGCIHNTEIIYNSHGYYMTTSLQIVATEQYCLQIKEESVYARAFQGTCNGLVIRPVSD